MAKLETFITPVATAVYPSITAPDTRFDPDGVYKVSLSLEPEVAQGLVAKLDKAMTDFIGTLDPVKAQSATKMPVFEDEYTRPEFPPNATDDEKEAIKAAFVPEPTGNIIVKTKLKAKVQPKNGEAFTQSPVVVDAATGAAVEEHVGFGSKIRVKGQIAPYYNPMSKQVGLSLRMKAVQVVELVESGGDGAAYWTDFESE